MGNGAKEIAEKRRQARREAVHEAWNHTKWKMLNINTYAKLRVEVEKLLRVLDNAPEEPEWWTMSEFYDAVEDHVQQMLMSKIADDDEDDQGLAKAGD